MRGFIASLWAEVLKIRRSRIFLITIIFFMVVASMMSLVLFVQKYPEVSGKLGMIGDKAALLRFGEPDWQNYFRLLIEGMAGVGLVGIGFLTSWVFGREFSDRTVKDILALPVARHYIVLSKFIVIVLWFIILVITYFLSGLLLGMMIGLPGFTVPFLIKSGLTYFATSALIILLASPVAFFASWSKGYMFPLAFVILTLILANFSGLVGLGPYFPWAIPGLYGNPSGAEGMQLKIISYIILAGTGILGVAGTIILWRFGDHK